MPRQDGWIGNPIGPWMEDDVNGAGPLPPGPRRPPVRRRPLRPRAAYKVVGQPPRAAGPTTATALEALPSFELDLYHLRVSKVTVDVAAPAKYSHHTTRLVIRLRTPVEAGAELHRGGRLRAASPAPMPGLDGDAGWEELTDGVIVASQPHGAPTWFPCNDRPSNKATYRVTVRTDPGYVVVSNGTLTAERRVGRRVDVGARAVRADGDLPGDGADRALRARARQPGGADPHGPRRRHPPGCRRHASRSRTSAR